MKTVRLDKMAMWPGFINVRTSILCGTTMTFITAAQRLVILLARGCALPHVAFGFIGTGPGGSPQVFEVLDKVINIGCSHADIHWSARNCQQLQLEYCLLHTPVAGLKARTSVRPSCDYSFQTLTPINHPSTSRLLTRNS